MPLHVTAINAGLHDLWIEDVLSSATGSGQETLPDWPYILLTQISLAKSQLIIILWFYYTKLLTGYD